MPVAPPPQTFRCPKCHWSKTVVRRSDVLMPGDHFSKCPSCGNGSLDVRPADFFDATLANVGGLIRTLMR